MKKYNKANSMLRRFFSRFGGAGLDAFGFKKTMEVSSDNGGGGDTPSGGMLLTDIHYKNNVVDFLASLPYNDGEGIRTGEVYRIRYLCNSNKIDFVEYFD